MVRQKYLKNVKLHALDEAVLARYFRHYDPKTLHLTPEHFPPLTAEQLFGNQQPLELEVGCGTGEFLCSVAASQPAVNFVGIDNWRKALYRAVENADALALTNIRFLHADFLHMGPLLRPNSAQQVYLHFPPPYYRRGRFQKAQLFTPTFLDWTSLILTPGGRLSVMTDHADYFLEMLTLIESDPRFEKVHQERSLTGFSPAEKSRFQRIWERYGLEVLRFEVRKRAGDYNRQQTVL